MPFRELELRGFLRSSFLRLVRFVVLGLNPRLHLSMWLAFQLKLKGLFAVDCWSESNLKSDHSFQFFIKLNHLKVIIS